MVPAPQAQLKLLSRRVCVGGLLSLLAAWGV